MIKRLLLLAGTLLGSAFWLEAQVTLTLIPDAPDVFCNASSCPPATKMRGAVVFNLNVGGKTATVNISIQGPSSISGTGAPVFKLSSPATFTIQETHTGVDSVSLSTSSQSGDCNGPGPCVVNAVNYFPSLSPPIVTPLVTATVIRAGGTSFPYEIDWNFDATPGTATDSISIGSTLPDVSQSLWAVADNLPAFCAVGKYTYNGTNTARVVLELSDDSGKLIADSTRTKPVLLSPGANQDWGGGCKDPKALTFIPDNPQVPMPSFNIPTGTPVDQVLGNLTLRAFLQDTVTSQRTAVSSPVRFNVIPGITATFQILDKDDKPVANPIILAQASGGESEIVGDSGVRGTVLDAAVNLAGGVALMNLTALETGVGGAALGDFITGPRPLVKGPNHLKFLLATDISLIASSNVFARNVPARTTLVHFIPKVLLEDGQVVELAAFSLSAESISVVLATPGPATCRTVKLPQCLVTGSDNTIQVNGLATAQKPNERITRIVSVQDKKNNSTTSNVVLPVTLTPGQSSVFMDTIPTALPSNTKNVQILYLLTDQPNCIRGCAGDSLTYTDFTTQAAVLAAGITNGAFQLVDGALNGVASKTARQVNNVNLDVGLAGLANNVTTGVGLAGQAKDTGDLLKAYKIAASQNPPFLAIRPSWNFDPPIPRDGSFSASLSLNYFRG